MAKIDLCPFSRTTLTCDLSHKYNCIYVELCLNAHEQLDNENSWVNYNDFKRRGITFPTKLIYNM